MPVGATTNHSPSGIVKSILAITAVRTLFGTLLVWLLVFGACKSLLWRDPHSGFFADATVYDLKYSQLRLNEAHQFIQDAERGSLQHEPVHGPDPVVCAALVTVNRDKRQYLNETIGSLLTGLTPEERSAINVRLLFGNIDPKVHPDWNRPWLRELDHWAEYNVSAETGTHLRQLEDDHLVQEKGVYDYIYMLQQCLQETNAPYIAVFEDDIVFAEGWLAKTLDALAELRLRSSSWLYMRLFYTETHLGWREETDAAYRHRSTTFLLAMSAVLCALLFSRFAVRNSRRYLDQWTIGVVVLFAVPMFVQLTFMVGKHNLVPLKGVVEMPKWGCCTQALLFPRSQVPSLIANLRERKTGQTDLLIEEYADTTGLGRYALAPQVVQHIGLVSSRGMAEVNTKSVWAFWFEAQDPMKLKKEHDRLSRHGIWRATVDI